MRTIASAGLIFSAAVACTGGGGGSGAPASSGTSSGGGSGVPADSDCTLDVRLSGGLNDAIGGVEQLCVIATGPSVGFGQLDRDFVVVIVIRDMDEGQTGTFAAEVEVRQTKAAGRWRTSKCSIAVTEHVLVTPAGDGGLSPFDKYRMRATGSCTEPAAALAADGGAAADPVTIGPFSFVFQPIW